MEQKRGRLQILLPILIDLVAMYVITGILLLLLAFFMYKGNLPEAVMNGAIIAIYVIAGFFGGFFIGRYAGVRKYLWGMLIGGLYYLILVLVGLILHRGIGSDPVHLFSTLALCLLSSTAGGMLS